MPDPNNQVTTGMKERSSYIRSFLRDESGVVDSVFPHSLNISFGRRLLHLGSASSGLSVFGITMPTSMLKPLLSEFRLGDQVAYTNGEILVQTVQSGLVKLRLSDFQEVPLCIDEINLSTADLIVLLRLLQSQHLGEGIGLSPDDANTAERLLTDKSNEWAQRATEYLIGRGKGLTPSGDDILVGFLAVALASRDFKPSVRSLISALPEITSRATTLVSLNYLQACMAGYVSQDIKDLLTAVVNEQPETQIIKQMQLVLTMGHTSGHDTLLGMMIAAKRLLEEKHES